LSGAKRRFAGLFVRLRDRPNDPTRIADSDRIARNVFDDDAAAPDHDIAPDRDAGHALHTAADPHMIAHGDWVSILQPPLAALGVDWVAGRVKPAVWRHEHVLAERHRGAIENDEIVVGVKVLPEPDVVAVIAPGSSAQASSA